MMQSKIQKKNPIRILSLGTGDVKFDGFKLNAKTMTHSQWAKRGFNDLAFYGQSESADK